MTEGNEDLYFTDKIHKIDYVLVYTDTDDKWTQKRLAFEASLRDEGLLLEVEDKNVSKCMSCKMKPRTCSNLHLHL